MPDLRLTGTSLRLIRHLTAFPPLRAALWAATKGDFRIDALRALPASARLPLDATNHPVAGRAPHTWEDAGHAPSPHDGEGPATVATLHTAYRDAHTTPSEVLSALLNASSTALGHTAHSPFVAVDEARARADADASTQRFRDGAPLGPLDGVPVPVKDEVHIRGLPTAGGTAYLTAPATEDAWVVQRLRAAGAIVFAKTACTEWGMNPVGINAHTPMPRNPWKPDHAAGGSSTGSAVAVAMGLAPVALGSDGGGSIRIPAALCGVFGLKPTWVRIGRTGDTWGPGTMPHLGPLGASPADLVSFLTATAGVDPHDPATRMAPDAHDVAAAWRAALGRGVRGARIGVDDALWADVDPDVARIAMAAVDALVADGAVKVSVSLPLAAHAPGIGALTIASESSANLSDDFAAHGTAFGDELALILRIMGALPARDLLGAARTRAALRRQVASCFASDVDLLALPSTATTAPRYPRTEHLQDVLWTSATSAMTRTAFLGNLTGLPAGTAPVGLHQGLPVGLQLIGDAWDEASVLAGLAQVERIGLSAIGAPQGRYSILG